ncbi:hypothetical protein HK104_007007 [Borealophlyctis nickersoniae]|nr:hypothetical protein HK104_007007 [Borealophlyctis nickersoniae]
MTGPPADLLFKENLTVDSRDVDTPDNWIPRDPSLIRLTGIHPFNCEPNLSKVVEAGPLTPTAIHFVRNHGPVPKISWDEHVLTVGGLVKTPRTFTMAELVAMPSIEVPVTLTCCGNRRKEQNMVKRSQGFSWGAGGISTAVWKGVPLRHILNLCGLDDSQDHSSLFVCTDGGDTLPKGTYGTSIVLPHAMNPTTDVMVAYAMNGHILTPDHGYPLRMIIPGFVGGRMVKWLKTITVTDTESSAPYHYYDNRVLPPPPVGPSTNDQAEKEGWWFKPDYIINERNINSVISHPAHDESLDVRSYLASPDPTYTLKGYAYSGGGRKVTRVEVSMDDGVTWELVDELTYGFEPRHGDKYWCWFLWEHKVEVGRLLGAKEVMVRAWDSAQNTQPKEITWNLLGMMNNA